ncbi:MAG: hypothetical protein JWR26_3124 [Pedosphaera sp.]|nr:hypothetical protein [Pedosphaera sp.]
MMIRIDAGRRPVLPQAHFLQDLRLADVCLNESAHFNSKLMKKLSVILFVATAMASQQVSWAQSTGQPALRPGAQPSATQATEPDLPRFNLDFPGGTPAELVKAIEQQSSSRPLNLNVIIPNDPAVKATFIPPLVMKSVTVPELFNALSAASIKEITYKMVGGSYQQSVFSYSFRTEGKPREDSIWYFRMQSPAPPPGLQTIRFFQLGPYLQTYKVEDITTAIETGWKMLGEEPYPKLSFHKDTKLLIAVGDPNKLESIEAVLSQLPKDKPAAEKVPAPDKSNEPRRQ